MKICRKLFITRYGKPTFIAFILFRNMPEINWFFATNYQNQDADYLENKIPETFENWFIARSIQTAVHSRTS